MHKISHAIYRQAVYNENKQNVSFKEGEEEAFINKDWDTTFTAWFKLNQEDPSVNKYLYPGFNQHYAFIN